MMSMSSVPSHRDDDTPFSASSGILQPSSNGTSYPDTFPTSPRESRIPLPRRLATRRSAIGDLSAQNSPQSQNVQVGRRFMSHHHVGSFVEPRSPSHLVNKPSSRNTLESHTRNKDQTISNISSSPQESRLSDPKFDIDCDKTLEDVSERFDESDSLLGLPLVDQESILSPKAKSLTRNEHDRRLRRNTTASPESSQDMKFRRNTTGSIPDHAFLEKLEDSAVTPSRQSIAAKEMENDQIVCGSTTDKRYGDIRQTTITRQIQSISTLASFRKAREIRRQSLQEVYEPAPNSQQFTDNCVASQQNAAHMPQKSSARAQMEIVKNLDTELAELASDTSNDGCGDSNASEKSGGGTPDQDDGLVLNAQTSPQVHQARTTLAPHRQEENANASEVSTKPSNRIGSDENNHPSTGEESSPETLSVESDSKHIESKTPHVPVSSRFSMANLNLESLENLSKSVGRRRVSRSSNGSVDYHTETPVPTMRSQRSQ